MKGVGKGTRVASANMPLQHSGIKDLRPSTILQLKRVLFDRYSDSLPVIAVYVLRYMVQEHCDKFVKLDMSSDHGCRFDFEQWLMRDFVDEDRLYSAEEMWARITYKEKNCRPHYDLVTRSFANAESAWRFLTGAAN